jgi:hypothetical protein
VKTSDDISELATALAAAQPSIEGATKDKTNPAFRTKYADLGSVWDAIREPMKTNGLSIVQLPITLVAHELPMVGVSTRLMHSSGQWIEEEFVVPLAKLDPQGAGSAITYCRRYSLMAVLGVCPEDDDGNSASERPQERAAAPVPQRPATWTTPALKKILEDNDLKMADLSPILGAPVTTQNFAGLIDQWLRAPDRDLQLLAESAHALKVKTALAASLPPIEPADLSPRADVRQEAMV